MSEADDATAAPAPDEDRLAGSSSSHPGLTRHASRHTSPTGFMVRFLLIDQISGHRAPSPSVRAATISTDSPTWTVAQPCLSGVGFATVVARSGKIERVATTWTVGADRTGLAARARCGL